MSYSYQVPAGPFETFNERAKVASQGPSVPEGQQQGAADAAALAAEIVASGIVGAAPEWVTASISGHVQTGEGSARPACSIFIFQVPPEPSEGAEE